MCIKPSLPIFFSLEDQRDFYQGYLLYAHNSNSQWMTMPLTAQGKDHLLLLAPLLLNKSPFWQMLLLFTSHWQSNGPISSTSRDLQPSASFRGSWGNHIHNNYSFFWVLLDTPEWLNKADALQSCMLLKQLRSLSPYLWKRLSSCSATWFPNTPRCSHEDKNKCLKISGWSQPSFARHRCCALKGKKMPWFLLVLSVALGRTLISRIYASKQNKTLQPGHILTPK